MQRSVMAAVLMFLIAGPSWVGQPSRGAESDPHARAPGLEQAIGDFWRNWQGIKPSDAIRRAAATPDFQRLWDETGQRADEFQGRLGGRCLGHSEIARKSLGDNAQYVSFFALYDPTPLRVEMLFYRARDTWKVIALRVDADPARWLEETSQSLMPAPAPATVQLQQTQQQPPQ